MTVLRQRCFWTEPFRTSSYKTVVHLASVYKKRWTISTKSEIAEEDTFFANRFPSLRFFFGKEVGI